MASAAAAEDVEFVQVLIQPEHVAHAAADVLRITFPKPAPMAHFNPNALFLAADFEQHHAS